jgi:two-component system response regulator
MRTDAILLVEDNVDDAAFTALAFKKGNFRNEIVVAQDGEKALSRLLPENQEVPLRPVIVLLDINMPKVGGFDVLRRLRSAPSTHLLPIVMLTTSNLSEDILESYRLGANGYACKSVSFDNFQQTISALGTYWLQVNQRPPDPRVAGDELPIGRLHAGQ